ncbi:major facilitator superfamily domain-containing protein 6-like [Antedon mediterranea]|uniref:major facilitator superfamily domain-containing protein 6-like n=1 Tax=Antedon mediterranea TaxID=105859 RepID=UPI003AF5264C
MTAESSNTGAKDELKEGVPETLRQKTWRALRDDNISLRIIPIFVYGALACIAPYLSLYLRQLGLDAFRIGMLFTIRPALGVFCTPLWGFIADRFKIWRFVFILSIIGLMMFGPIVILFKPAEREPCDVAISNLATLLDVPPDNYSTNFNQSVYENEAYLDELKETMIEIEAQKDKTWLYEPEGVVTLFWEFVFVIVLYEIFFAANLSFLDVSIISELKDNPKFYSKFRSFGSLGWILGSLITAAILQHYRKELIICGIDFIATNYKIAFMMMAGFYACSLPIGCTLKYDHLKSDKEYYVKNFLLLLCTPEHISVYAIGTFVGVCNGFVWYFLNYHLENLGATQLLMGIATTIGASSEMVWGLFFQVPALERLGHINILTMALALYCCRFLMYALMKNPLWILPVEVIQGVSYFAVWNTLVSYTVNSFPIQFTATSITFVNAAVHNLGLGCGTLLSGFLIDRYNSTTTCFIYCVSSACFLLLFMVARRNFTDIQPEIESMNLITSEENEKDKMRKSVESTRLRTSTPPTPDLAPTQVQTPAPVTKSYSSIADKDSP